MEREKIKVGCPKCKKPFAIIKPAAPGTYSVKCPHCQGVIRLQLRPVEVKMQQNAQQQNAQQQVAQQQNAQQPARQPAPLPFLGKPELSNRGIYVVRESAVVGVKSQFACPKCGKAVIVDSAKAGHFYVKCSHCGTATAVKVEEAPATAPGTPSDKPKKTTRRMSNNTPAERGQLTWGSLFRRKRHELRNGSTVLGRKDDEQPSDLMFDDATMSCRSVRLDVDPTDGSCRLSVLHATNPVMVNGVVYPEGSSIYLTFNDKLKMGRTVIDYGKIK